MRNLLVIFFLGVFSMTFAQDTKTLHRPKIKWGEEYKEPSSAEMSKIIATEGGGFYVMRTKAGGVFGSAKAILEYNDQNMRLRRSAEIDLRYNGKPRLLKDVVAMDGGKLYLLTYFYNKKLEKTFLFAQRINTSSFTLAAEITKVAEWEGDNTAKEDVFSYQISRDSTKLIIYSRATKQSKDRDELGFDIFDQNMKNIWGRFVVLPYPRGKYEVSEVQVDNAGNAYLLGIVQEENPNSNKFFGNNMSYSQYHLLMVSQDEEKPKEHQIRLQDKYITNLAFRIADNQDIIMAGFYSEKNAFSAKGSCYFRINPNTQKIEQQSIKDFNLDLVTANLSQRNRERAKAAAEKGDLKNQAELKNYNIEKLILRSDGGALLIAEQYFVEERITSPNYAMNPWMMGGGMMRMYDPWGYRYNNMNNRSDYIFHYNDILVINIAPDGTIDWAARVPKHQMTTNDHGRYSSFTSAHIEDKLYFIYNDNPRNFKQKGIIPTGTNREVFTNRGDVVVVLSEVNQNGEVRSVPLFTDNDADVSTIPKISRQVTRNNIVIYGERGSHYRFAGLQLNELKND